MRYELGSAYVLSERLHVTHMYAIHKLRNELPKNSTLIIRKNDGYEEQIIDTEIWGISNILYCALEGTKIDLWLEGKDKLDPEQIRSIGNDLRAAIEKLVEQKEIIDDIGADAYFMMLQSPP